MPSPPPQREADLTEEPIAVHPHDLDSVFLSKTIVSLKEVFANTVDDRFDVSPLPTSAATKPIASHTNDESVFAMPFSGGSQPCVATTPRGASPRHSTLSVQQYNTIAQAAGAHRTLVNDSNQGSGSTPASTLSTSSKASSSTPPQLLVVPLDAYHTLLSFRDVDCAKTRDAVRNENEESRKRDGRVFAAAMRRAMSSVEKVSAQSPGPRPPRCGVAVVRRLEGEMQSATTAGAKTVYPTLSRVAQSLPFRSFDGWVRDYTVYGLSRNAAALRAAWEDKLHEREERIDSERQGEDDKNGDDGAAVLRAHPAGTVIEVEVPPLQQQHADPLAATIKTSQEVNSEDKSKDDDVGVDPEISVECAPDSPEKQKKNTAEAKAASPSLERLNCSSTTASSSVTSNRSFPSDPQTTRGNSKHETTSTTAVGDMEQQKTAAAGEAAAADISASTLPYPEQLWSEERRREAYISSQLAHRFMVSDSAQHAIWAIEVTLPSMRIRVVAPTEFYSLQDEPENGKDESNDGAHAKQRANVNSARNTVADVSETRLPRKRLATDVTQTRTRTPSPATRNTTAGRDVQLPQSPLPVEPPAVSSRRKMIEEDKEKGSPQDSHTNAVDVSPSCPASDATQAPHNASPSFSRSRSSKSASPSLALAETVALPLMGGARGFVDGHFSVARFNAPGALCWRVDDEEEEKTDVNDVERSTDDLLSYLQSQRRCTVLFISDVGNCAIRYANFHNRLVRTIAGMDGVPGYRDGSCVSSLLRGATALAWCSAGLLFTDGPNNVVRLITHVSKKTYSQAGRGRASQKDGPDGVALPSRENEASQRNNSFLEEAENVHQRVDETSQQPSEPSSGGALGAVFANAATSHSAITATAPPEAPAADANVEAIPSDQIKKEKAVNTSDSEAARTASPSVVPRVWTLAGCVRGADVTDADINTIIDHTISTTLSDSTASYVDCSVPSRACFGYLSDMALWTDETGNTQVYLLDQTHHAVRVLDVEGGVSTYVGPLDYASLSTPTRTQSTHEGSDVAPAGAVMATDTLPAGLVYPSHLAMVALIKERSPALIDCTNADMLTPQPYLYSSTPALFVASAITGAVSVLLPISQRSDIAPWNTTATAAVPLPLCQKHSKGHEDAQSSSVISSVVLQQIHNALLLGVATEGRRTIGEATTPSLKHVIAAWNPIEEKEAETYSEEHGKNSAQTRCLLRHARLQQALLYLRLRFPWVLPPAVMPLSPRLVAGCTCHLSGKRRGTTAQRHPVTSFVRKSAAQSNERAATGIGVSLLPRSGGDRAATTSPPRRPMQPQRLLFNTPPRYPVTAPYTQALKDPRTAAAAKAVADLLLFQPGATVTVPRIVEVKDAEPPAAREEVDAVASSEKLGTQNTCSSNNSNGPPPTREEEQGDVEVKENALVDRDEDNRNEEVEQRVQRARGEAAPKWLPPPTKSLSRSPGSTPRCDAEKTAEALRNAVDVAPAKSPPSSYAAKFECLPTEQRQLRLQYMLEEPTPFTGGGGSGAAAAAATPYELFTSPSPKKNTKSEDDDDSVAQERSESDKEHWTSPQRSSRQHRTPSRSPKNSNDCASPPLTPRAMAAHQLMQRRRTSRSNTAPHVTSVGSTADMGKGASQEQENVTMKGAMAGLKTPKKRGGEVDEENSEEERREGSPQQGRPPLNTVHEAGEAERQTALVRPMRPSLFHDDYDAAVQRLFRVYAYFATRTVRHVSTAQTRRLPREVEHYSMTFCAFYRFAVLTGFLDYVVDTAATAATAIAERRKTDEQKAEAALLWKWSARLTQVQRRGAAATTGMRSGIHSASSEGTSTRMLTTATSLKRPTSSRFSSSLQQQQLLLLPLAASDSRAVADVLYHCGVRRQGYHVVTCMDFQSFRRAVLLLRTWAMTAALEHDKSRNTKMGKRDAAQGEVGRNGAAVFAYLDRLPSLDALTAEEVVAAYSEVYTQAVRNVPALQALDVHNPEENYERNGETKVAVEREGQPPPLLTVQRPHRRSFESAESPGDGGGMGRGHAAHHPQRPQAPADAVTPPVSPISLAKNGEDVFSVLDEVNDSNDPTGESAAPPYANSTLSREERLALDDLLRLLQRNESSLRQLFDAYSVPLVVHRSAQYEAPHSAAAAAAASNPCSLLMSDSRSLRSRDVSQIGGVGGRPRKVWEDSAGSSLTVTALPEHQRQQPQRGAGRAGTITARTTASTAGLFLRSSVTPAEAALLQVTAAVPANRQDMWWKVQQLYTMSSLENKEVYERTSHMVRVVPYKLFVELWRTLDVFPSLMTATATQQAYLDAVTTVLLRGTGGSSGVVYGASLKSCGKENESASPVPSLGKLEPTAAEKAKLKAKTAQEKSVEELLLTHTGLTFPCFVESFVRVAMTVFSHDVDRVAYPTGAAKTTGLMQWCNKHVRLGLVEQRTQQHLHNAAAAAVEHGRLSHRLRDDVGAEVGASYRSSAAASSLLATRGVRSFGMFPDQLELFHVPPTKHQQ